MRNKRLTLACVALVACQLGLATAARAQDAGVPDPFGLLRPQPYVAARSSSNNPDPESNDDSKRPIPGETIVLADLEGPGSVSHIWMTVADNEYGWPRLLRLRVYYDGSPEPSVDAPRRRLLRGRPRLRAARCSRSWCATAPKAARATATGRCRSASRCRITVTNEGRRRVANLYYQVDWQKLRSLPEGTPYFHARYRQALPNRRRPAVRGAERRGPRPLRGHRPLRGAGRGRLVRRGRRPLLRGRRGEAVARGDGHRGLLQRRLGPPRERRALYRRSRGGRHRPRLAHDAPTAGTSRTRCRSRSRCAS